MGKSKARQDSPETGTERLTATLQAFGPGASSVWMDVMAESARFISDRFQQDLEAQKALLACKTPADLMKVQTEFYQSAMQQYAEETTRLFQMMSSATQDGVKQAELGKGRAYDDIPL